MLYVISRCFLCYSDNCFKKFLCWENGVLQWVPKSKIVNIAEMPKNKGKAKIMVPRQRLLKTYDRREVYVTHPHNERRRKCEVWRQPV